MKSIAVINQIDKVLGRVNFVREGATWNRKMNSIVEVIDIQVSKAGDMVTLNAGVLEMDTYTKCWGREPPEFIEEPFCVVRARVGELLGENDLWWSLDDGEVVEKIVEVLTSCVLPFQEKMRRPAAMEEFLATTSVLKQMYPLPKIYLAILKHRGGDRVSACAILGDLGKKGIGDWRARAKDVARRLGCDELA